MMVFLFPHMALALEVFAFSFPFVTHFLTFMELNFNAMTSLLALPQQMLMTLEFFLKMMATAFTLFELDDVDPNGLFEFVAP